MSEMNPRPHPDPPR